MQLTNKDKSTIKKFKKILLKTLAALLLFMVCGSILLSLPIVQTQLADLATSKLNKTFGTDIEIKKLSASLFTGAVSLKGIFITDYKKDTLIHIDKLQTSIISVGKALNGDLQFGKINLQGFYFNLKTYKGETDTNLDVFVDKLDDGEERAPGEPPFLLSSSQIKVKDGSFKMSDENDNNEQLFYFTNLGGEVHDFLIEGPNVQADVVKLSLNTERGVSVNNLKTYFCYTRTGMTFDNLSILTPGSRIEGALKFSYKREELSEFVDKVKLDATFNESTIFLKELNKFYPEFDPTETVTFTTEISGVLNNFKAKDFELHAGNTAVFGDFSFYRLFKKGPTFEIDANIEHISSSYLQLRRLLPNILGKNLPSNLVRLGQFSIQGQSVITDKIIDAELKFHSRLGKARADLKLSETDHIDNAAYSGIFALDDFDLGTFINEPDIGRATLEFDVKGRGFTKENLDTWALGSVESVVYNDYPYKNLNVSGVFRNQQFNGKLVANDPNATFVFEGLADLSGIKNKFNFSADVSHADLHKTNFMTEKIALFTGKVEMNILGNNINNVAGEMLFINTQYTNTKDQYFFDDFKITSIFNKKNERLLYINSPDIITGTLKGNFDVWELNNLIKNAFGSLYANYKPLTVKKGQYFSFNMRLYNKILEVFYPDIRFGKNTFLKGEIQNDENKFKFSFKAPSFSAFGNNFQTLDIQIDNNNPLFNTYAQINNIETPWYNFKDFSIINARVKDTLFFRTEFNGGKDLSDLFHLNFYHTKKGGQSVFGIKKSDITFKGRTWLLNKNNNRKNRVVLSAKRDSVAVEEIIMSYKGEQMVLSGSMVDSTYKNLNLNFKNVALNKITPAIDSLKLNGKINGSLNVFQNKDSYIPSSNLRINDLAVNDLLMGDLKTAIVGDASLTKYGVNIDLDQNKVKKLNVNGSLDFGPKEARLDLGVTLNALQLEPFSALGEDVITNIRGTATGKVQLSGLLKNPAMQGAVTLHNASLKIPYLNTTYALDHPSQVNLYSQTFEFGEIGFTDVKHNTTASINGIITHNEFDNWFLDFDLDTRQKPLLVLDTELQEETLYYGTGFLSGDAKIFGPSGALTIEVAGKTEPGTIFKVPVSDVAGIGDYSFINFLDKNATPHEIEERRLAEFKGLELAFDLDVTPDAEIEIVIDQKSGSTLKGRGAGNLLIEINTNGKFNMYGDFITFDGDYNFKYGGLIDKKFKVRPGGTITWDKEPLEALINMEAVYSLTANPALLLDNPGFRRRIPTDVIIKLNSKLLEFDPDFEIEFPGTNAIVNAELQYRLEDNDKRELQALSLLSQGTFIDEVSITRQAITGNLYETASSLVNQLFADDESKINVGFSYEQGSRNPNAEIQTEDRLGVTVTTQISERVLFNGKIGVPVGGVSETLVAGDVEIEILLNEEGSLSAKIFNRENQIQQFITDGPGYTQGVGLSYQVEFDTFKELLRNILKKKNKKKEKKQEDSQQIREKSEEKKITNDARPKNDFIRFSSKANQK